MNKATNPPMATPFCSIGARATGITSGKKLRVSATSPAHRDSPRIRPIWKPAGADDQADARGKEHPADNHEHSTNDRGGQVQQKTGNLGQKGQGEQDGRAHQADAADATRVIFSSGRLSQKVATGAAPLNPARALAAASPYSPPWTCW